MLSKKSSNDFNYHFNALLSGCEIEDKLVVFSFRVLTYFEALIGQAA